MQLESLSTRPCESVRLAATKKSIEQDLSRLVPGSVIALNDRELENDDDDDDDAGRSASGAGRNAQAGCDGRLSSWVLIL
jgi:hypothetical protein